MQGTIDRCRSVRDKNEAEAPPSSLSSASLSLSVHDHRRTIISLKPPQRPDGRYCHSTSADKHPVRAEEESTRKSLPSRSRGESRDFMHRARSLQTGRESRVQEPLRTLQIFSKSRERVYLFFARTLPVENFLHRSASTKILGASKFRREKRAGANVLILSPSPPAPVGPNIGALFSMHVYRRSRDVFSHLFSELTLSPAQYTRYTRKTRKSIKRRSILMA